VLFIVRLTDHPDRHSVREQFLDAHKAWLAANHQQIRAAGLLREDPQGPALAACWIVEGPSRAEVQRLVQQDPFWLSGLRETCAILHWSRAFPPGPVAI
jgi:uncharacterized protein